MNGIIRYCLTGIKVFIACVIAFVATKEAILQDEIAVMLVLAATAIISVVYLVLGVGQLFGFFLNRTVSRIIHACEWFILAYLACRLCMCLK